MENNFVQLDRAARWAVAKVAAGLQSVRGNRCNEGFGILMYHRVIDRCPGVDAPTWNVTPAQLRQQLQGLLDRGFEPRSLSSVIASHRDGTSIPSNVFVVTFDDGHVSNYDNAWPILRDLNVPATIFLATKYLDSAGSFPFDDWSAVGSSRVPAAAWRPLTTAECAEMLAGGLIGLGAHTHSHEHFLNRHDEFRTDLQLCLDVLRDRFGIERPTFSFPFGEFGLEMVDIARKLDVACCLTTQEQRVRSTDDPYEWGRFTVESVDTAPVLAAKLSGWYTTVARPGKTIKRSLATFASPAVRQPDRCNTIASHGDSSAIKEAATQR